MNWFEEIRPPFTGGIIDCAIEHAKTEAPKEAVGAVVCGEYLPLINRATDPESTFKVSQEDIAGLQIEALIHSHPKEPHWPSKQDMIGQQSMGVPWAIVTTEKLSCIYGDYVPSIFLPNGLHNARAFMPNISDCFTIARQYFVELGHEYPDLPRDWEFWEHGQNLYLENLPKYFDLVTQDPLEMRDKAQKHDLFLIKLRSDVPNHIGVYLGDGMVLDHMQNRLSEVRAVNPFIRHFTHMWRRKNG